VARFFPKEPLNHYASEALVRTALAQLDDTWRVFHSVAWQSERYGRQGDGEADFVILHPERGLLVLEVKGGERIEVDGGKWYSINSQTGERVGIKNPFEQARDSKYALLRYLAGVAPRLAAVPIAHAVAFPGASHNESIGPYGPRALVLDADDLRNAGPALERVFDHWGHRTQLLREDIDEITRRLAPTTTIRRRLGTAVGAANAELLQLTEQQKLAFHITRTRRRAAVVGGPGTGKSVLALERALYLAADGFKVLLTCFNRPLANQLAAATNDSNVTVRTFHALCLAEARKARVAVSPEEPGWWQDRAPDVLVEASLRTGASWDAIIIDEGQDFASRWFEALRLVLTDPDDGVFYVFYDPRQALLQPGWELPADLESFPLDWNCRNTLAIARKVCAVYGDEPLAIGTEGDRPQWMKAESADIAIRTAQELVDTFLVDEGLLPSQIAVLSDSRQVVARLQSMTVSTASFVEIGRDGVVAETVHRFKGLEADVVLLLLVSNPSIEEILSVAYVGMSRARAVLIVIGPRRLRSTLGWGG
jgi:hypothetical protein